MVLSISASRMKLMRSWATSVADDANHAATAPIIRLTMRFATPQSPRSPSKPKHPTHSGQSALALGALVAGTAILASCGGGTPPGPATLSPQAPSQAWGLVGIASDE